MQISLDNNELELAIAEYISNRGISTKGKNIEVTLGSTGGRQSTRLFHAEVTISDPVVDISASGEATVEEPKGEFFGE